jgi:hypothetical protein
MSVHSASNGANTPVTVSASELVRNFGEWQDRALNRPVFINKRGRSRLVLMASELLNAANGQDQGDGAERPDTGHPVIETLPLPVLLMDEQLVVRWHNRAAHDLFADSDAALIGSRFEQLTLFGGNDYPAAMLRRVCLSRMADSMELAVGSIRRERQLALSMQPVAGGVALIARDMGLHHALATAQAALGALDEALAMLPGVATLRINPRGYCTGSTASLTALTGLTAPALEQVRVASLFDVGSRVAVTDAVNAVFVDAAPRLIGATLLARGHDPVPVTVALGPIVSGSAILSVQAVLAVRQDDKKPPA